MISVSKKEVVYCPFCKKLSWKSCHCKTFLAGSPEAHSIRLAKGEQKRISAVRKLSRNLSIFWRKTYSCREILSLQDLFGRKTRSCTSSRNLSTLAIGSICEKSRNPQLPEAKKRCRQLYTPHPLQRRQKLQQKPLRQRQRQSQWCPQVCKVSQLKWQPKSSNCQVKQQSQNKKVDQRNPRIHQKNHRECQRQKKSLKKT